jgi:hypothetical protein
MVYSNQKGFKLNRWHLLLVNTDVVNNRILGGSVQGIKKYTQFF